MNMTLKDYNQKIDDTILLRGVDYFARGCIKQVEEISPGVFEFMVEGTEVYQVDIALDGIKVINYECNCPYDRGPVCKHVVAALIHLKQADPSLREVVSLSQVAFEYKIKESSSEAEDFRSLLDNIPHEELKSFIYEKAAKDSSLRNAFNVHFIAYRNIEETAGTYRKQIQSLIDLEEYDYDYYSDESIIDDDGISELLSFAGKQIEHKHFEDAFFICTSMMEELQETLEYDHSGMCYGFIEEACDILYKMAEVAITDSIRKQLLNYCIESFQKRIYAEWDWHIVMLDLASRLLKTESEAEKVMELLDTVRASDFDREKAEMIKYHIIHTFKGEGDADKYLEQHLDNFDLRHELISKVFAKKNFQKASELALGGVEYDKKNKPGLVKDWYVWLLKIAQAEKVQEKIIGYARLLYIGNYSLDIDCYKIMKKQVSSKDWELFVEKLIEEIGKLDSWSKTDQLADVFIREKSWNKLFELLKQSPTFHMIEDYEKYLKKEYAAELADLYAEAILIYMVNNLGRKYYQEVCRYIRRIKKLGCKDKATQIISLLKNTYPNRPAMIDELGRV